VVDAPGRYPVIRAEGGRTKDKENRQGAAIIAGGTQLASEFPLLRCAAAPLEFKKNAALPPWA